MGKQINQKLKVQQKAGKAGETVLKQDGARFSLVLQGFHLALGKFLVS